MTVEDDGVPFGRDDSDDDYAVGPGIADGRSDAQIDRERNLPPIPLGQHNFVIKSVKYATRDENTNEPSTKVHDVFVKDAETGLYDVEDQYESAEIEVTYAYAADTRLTIREKFRLWPDDEDKMPTYLDSAIGGQYARPVADRKSSGPLFYDQIRRYLKAVGHNNGEDGSIAETVKSLRDWRVWPDGSPRTVSLKVQEQTKRNEETGKFEPVIAPNGAAWRKVAMFSHERTAETVAKLGSSAAPARPAAPAKAPAAPASKSPAAAASAAKSPAASPAPAGGPKRKF